MKLLLTVFAIRALMMLFGKNKKSKATQSTNEANGATHPAEFRLR
jgi:hypothetical protein